MAGGKVEIDPKVLAKNCENFMKGAKKIFDEQGNGDMWFFELYHHLDDCKNALLRDQD